MKYVVVLGRICFSAIFLMSSFKHFDGSMVAYATNSGVPAASVLVPLSGILILLGGLSVLFGYKARAGGWALALFLVPVTLAMHKFWGLADAQAALQQQIHFMKNVSMLGGALLVAAFGAGPSSLDDLSRRKAIAEGRYPKAERRHSAAVGLTG